MGAPFFREDKQIGRREKQKRVWGFTYAGTRTWRSSARDRAPGARGRPRSAAPWWWLTGRIKIKMRAGNEIRSNPSTRVLFCCAFLCNVFCGRNARNRPTTRERAQSFLAHSSQVILWSNAAAIKCPRTAPQIACKDQIIESISRFFTHGPKSRE